MEEQVWFLVPAYQVRLLWLGFQDPCSLLCSSLPHPSVCPFSHTLPHWAPCSAPLAAVGSSDQGTGLSSPSLMAWHPNLWTELLAHASHTCPASLTKIPPVDLLLYTCTHYLHHHMILYKIQGTQKENSRGCLHGSAGKGACCQAYQPEFNPQETLHGRRRALPLASCSLTSTHTHANK